MSGGEGGGSKKASGGPPQIDFNTFILSLSTNALMHLGELAGPDGDRPPVNLALAKQRIDLVALLEEKTRGNLTGEEERLVQQLLTDLHARYAAVASRKDV